MENVNKEDFFNIVKKAESEYFAKRPCHFCVGNGCDDCRDCDDAPLRHELSSNVFKLKEEFKKLYNVDYDDYIKVQKLYSKHPFTKEDILLLYKDLCGRTTYGTKIKYDDGIFTFDDLHCGIGMLDPETSPKIILSGCYYGDDIKPYLFPLSSMTEEQKEEYTFIVDYISSDDSDTLAEGEFIYVDLIT